jgi:hypothetical protein
LVFNIGMKNFPEGLRGIKCGCIPVQAQALKPLGLQKPHVPTMATGQI